MEKPKSNANLLAALGSLLGIIGLSGAGLGITLAQIPRFSPPVSAAPFEASILVLALVFLPLLWGRTKAGYIGAIGVGVLTIVGLSPGFGDVFAGVLDPSSIQVFIVGIVVAVVLIVTSATAWREKT